MGYSQTGQGQTQTGIINPQQQQYAQSQTGILPQQQAYYQGQIPGAATQLQQPNLNQQSQQTNVNQSGIPSQLGQSVHQDPQQFRARSPSAQQVQSSYHIASQYPPNIAYPQGSNVGMDVNNYAGMRSGI